MPFNSVQHRNNLHDVPEYLAHPNFLKNIAFKQFGSGNILVNKISKEPQIVVAVGKVLTFRLRCGPSGTYSVDSQFGTLASSKFQFYVSQPDEDAWQSDFNTFWDNLSSIQESISRPACPRRHLLELNGQNKNIRFTAPLFELRVSMPIAFSLLKKFRLRSLKAIPVSSVTVQQPLVQNTEERQNTDRHEESNGTFLMT
jgi:hypothetical protein